MAETTAKSEPTRAAPAEMIAWQRFWAPRTGHMDLELGFLVDPTDGYAWSRPTCLMSLPELAQYRALALLGEPGMGKSITLKSEFERAVSNETTAFIHVDLRAFSSESLLYQRVFESSELSAWKAGTKHLTLYLDSLDEALLRIDTIANLLASELPRLPTERLSLRIACRTAVWPENILESALRSIWGEDSVGVFELAPLRRKDVVAAAEAARIKSADFLKELYAADAVPFAIKPLTLQLLLKLYRKDGRLPRSIAEIYMLGCLSLCEEQNPSRRDARRSGKLTPRQRLRLGSRLAAVTMLSNRYAIWTGTSAETKPEEDVSLSALAFGREEGEFQPFEITEDAIREVFDTGLFSSRGPSRMGWAHQSYAEFLAAQYLIEKKVPLKNILKIFVHPTGGLVPQLSVVTAWVASLDREVRDALIASEPLVLLRGDLVNWSDEDLRALTHSLLRAYNDRRASDSVLGIRSSYAKLRHPGLASSLKTYINDKSKNIVARRAALMIAEACEAKELEPDLLAIALDQTDAPHVRARAVSALSTCGSDAAAKQLIPLTKSEAGPDPNDEIKGEALEIVWPRHMTAVELFATLAQPAEGFFGSYANFLTQILPGTLSTGHLVVALSWATDFLSRVQHMGDYNRKRLSDSIFMLGWRHFEESALTAIFVAHVFVRLRHGGELFRGSSSPKPSLADINADAPRRRSFLLAAASRSFDRMEAFQLMHAALLQRSDFEWLLSISPVGEVPISSADPRSLCVMIAATFDANDSAHFEALYPIAERWEPLRQEFSWLLDGLAIDSPDADQARKHLRLRRQLEEARLSSRPHPPPEQRVRGCLDKFEEGDSLQWCVLNRELTLEADSTHYGNDLDYVITETPGWRDADASTRHRILRAAERILNDGTPDIDHWLGSTTVRLTDLAAYRALILLRQVERQTYDQLAPGVWRRWAPVVVAVPRDGGTSEGELHAQIIADTSAKAPSEVADTVQRIIRTERARANAGTEAQKLLSFFILRTLDTAWGNTTLKEKVFEELIGPDNTAAQFHELLDVLLKAGYIPARDHALSLLRDTNSPREYALVAAAGLTTYFAALAWTDLWRVISSDEELGTELVMRLAHERAFQTSFYTALDEKQIADLYIWMVRKFPYASDAQAGQPHWVGPQESAAHARDGMLRHLVALGTSASAVALRRIVSTFPDLTWLPYHLLEAEQTMRLKTWLPFSPQDILRVTASREGVLVQTPAHLLEVLVDALRKYERELHGEQKPVRALWDRQADGSFRPVEEDALSDQVRLFLKRTLVESGIVINREVEVGRVPGAPIGTRTDIKVDAIIRLADKSGHDCITAVVETKGCWNRELFSALEEQLYKRYLVPLTAPVGIYLVGWFDKPKWDDSDKRKTNTTALPPNEVQERLNTLACALPASVSVQTVVLDCHAP